jgi:hydrogenase maturation factor
VNETTKTLLPAGKAPAGLLAELLHGLPTSDPALLLGPAVGEDAAVIDFGAGQTDLLVAKSDPITFASEEIGYYAVNICANDLAVTGATPRFYLPTILLPAGKTDAADIRRIFEQIGAACQQLGVSVAGGHSEITPAVNQPVVAGTMLGLAPRGQVLGSHGARPGDLLLLAGTAAIEGTSIIAREMRSELLARGWPATALDTAARYLYEPGVSVLQPALLAARAGLVTAMHDPTEGGVATALQEIAVAAGVGLQVDLDAIPVTKLTERLCQEFGLDPLGVIASGALLATAAPDAVSQLQQLWAAHGWTSAAIGRVVPQSEGVVAYRAKHKVDFPHFAADEITRLWVS